MAPFLQASRVVNRATSGKGLPGAPCGSMILSTEPPSAKSPARFRWTRLLAVTVHRPRVPPPLRRARPPIAPGPATCVSRRAERPACLGLPPPPFAPRPAGQRARVPPSVPSAVHLPCRLSQPRQSVSVSGLPRRLTAGTVPLRRPPGPFRPPFQSIVPSRREPFRGNPFADAAFP